MSKEPEPNEALQRRLQEREDATRHTLEHLSPGARAFAERWQNDIKRAGRHHASRFQADVWAEFVEGLSDLERR